MDKENRELSNPFREAYVRGMDSFLKQRREEVNRLREEYVTPEKMANNMERYRSDLIEILGWPLTEPCRKMPKVTVCEEKEIEPGILMRRLQIEVLPGVPFYGMLFLPKGLSNIPLVISQHGGNGTPEQTADLHSPNGYKNMTVKLARRGCAVFAPQLLLWQVDDDAERNKPGYHIPHRRGEFENAFRQLGGGIIAVELFELQCALDYLLTLPQVDPNRAGMIGISYGGLHTQLLAAVDSRIKAASTNAFFNDRYAYCWSDFSWKGSALKMKDAEICGLIAPRALCVHVGTNDGVFSIVSAVKEIDRLKPFYEAQNASEQLKIIISDVNHTITDSDEEIDFLMHHLNG